jgi:hypothetical protein
MYRNACLRFVEHGMKHRAHLRQHTSAYVSIRQHTSGRIYIGMRVSAIRGARNEASRAPTSAYVSIRQDAYI